MKPLANQFQGTSGGGDIATPTCGGCCCCCCCAATVAGFAVLEAMNVDRLAHSNNVEAGKRMSLTIAGAASLPVFVGLEILALWAMGAAEMRVALTIPSVAVWAAWMLVVASLRRGAGQPARQAWIAATALGASLITLSTIEFFVAMRLLTTDFLLYGALVIVAPLTVWLVRRFLNRAPNS